MPRDESLPIVRDIMIRFARLTGLSSKRKLRRYLWTDAFAVCNFLELHHLTGEGKYKRQALSLVDQVHHVLGKHREDDPRKGWISGLDDEEGEMKPTIGGLRIGKKLSERELGEPFDAYLEQYRDGQYYHYLTRWMHALNKVSKETGDFTYNRWAMELAKAAHEAFTYKPSFGGRKHIYWKMSIDLSHPLVSSEGQNDPLDGLVTYSELQADAPEDPEWMGLEAEIADMAGICEGRGWKSEDPLGIGGLLCDAYRIAQLTLEKHFNRIDLLPTLLESSLQGLEDYLERSPLELSPELRLAFRELGLSLGLKAVERMQESVSENLGFFENEDLLCSWIDGLLRHSSLSKKIDRFWLKRENRKTESWVEHRNINMVMLATSLSPDGYLRL